MSSLLGLPVEVWVEIFGHYLQPDFIFDADLLPFQIEVFHQSLFEDNTQGPIDSVGKKRLNLMLVCQGWNAIVHKFSDEWVVSHPEMTNGLAKETKPSNKEVLMEWSNNSRRLTVLGPEFRSQANNLNSISALCFHITRSRYVGFLNLLGMDKALLYPQELKVLHLSSESQRISSISLKYLANTFVNLRSLSIVVIDVVIVKDAITFPRVTTLSLEIRKLDWVDDQIDMWAFPALRYLSLELWPSFHPRQSLFTKLLDKYSSQLYGFRFPNWNMHPPTASFPNLQAFATDFTDFIPTNTFLTREPERSCPIKYLIHTVHQVEGSGGDNPIELRMRRKRYYYMSDAVEIGIYSHITDTIPFCPQLETVYIPKEVKRIRTGKAIEETAQKFDLLQKQCTSRGVRILNIQGKPFHIQGGT